MDNKVSNRQAVCDTLIELAATDKDIVVLTSDSRGSAGLTEYVNKYPKQHIETGIAEQNIVSIAAGLAACGKKTVVASPACFLSMRSAEQIKVDVAYSGNNVVLLGISGGVSYGALGMTHHSLQDIAAIRAMPGIDVILPSDRHQTRAVFIDLMKKPRPAYVRIGRNPVPDVYESEQGCYVAGKAIQIKKGDAAAIIATGEMVKRAVDAAEILKAEGIEISVYDMHTLKPLDEEAIIEAAGTGFILTMEEHSIYGGLGSAVAQVTAENTPTAMKLLAIPDEPTVAGSSREVFEHYGLMAQNAAQIIKKQLNFA